MFLPQNAPQEWKDRAVLWNAVEESEKSKDSRLAREFVVALPVELSKNAWKELLRDFIGQQFVSDGMCADVAIHNTDDHNPHAHIMLTIQPLDENGKWQYKTEKEYLCKKNGEEKGFTAAEFKTAQADGWEKQYQYKTGKKKKYMTPSEAAMYRYERVSKYPKSTKYGRQNPVSERWNSEEQLSAWRAAWAEATNRYLQQYGHKSRIDYRSNAERGIDEQPTVHEGVVARAMEEKGFISDKCELNRQIKADNALLRELKKQVKVLSEAIKNTVPAVAEAMERLRSNMIIFQYQLLRIISSREKISPILKTRCEDLAKFIDLEKQIESKTKERKSISAEKSLTSAIHILKHREFNKQIAQLSEDLEELRSEKTILLQILELKNINAAEILQAEITSSEEKLKKLEAGEEKYSAKFNNAMNQYAELKKQAEQFDPIELHQARLAIRSGYENDVTKRLQETYGNSFDSRTFNDSKRNIAKLLNEDAEAWSIREKIRILGQEKQKPKQQKTKYHGHRR